jgi:hypothetical protein
MVLLSFDLSNLSDIASARLDLGYGTHEGWNGKIKKITDSTPIGEYLVTKKHSQSSLCETKWSGKLAHAVSP